MHHNLCMLMLLYIWSSFSPGLVCSAAAKAGTQTKVDTEIASVLLSENLFGFEYDKEELNGLAVTDGSGELSTVDDGSGELTTLTTTETTTQPPPDAPREPDLGDREENFGLSIRFIKAWLDDYNDVLSSKSKALAEKLIETLNATFRNTENNMKEGLKGFHVKRYLNFSAQESGMNVRASEDDAIDAEYDVRFDMSMALQEISSVEQYLTESVTALKNETIDNGIVVAEYIDDQVLGKEIAQVRETLESKRAGGACDDLPYICEADEMCYPDPSSNIGIMCQSICYPVRGEQNPCQEEEYGKNRECNLVLNDTHYKDYNEKRYYRECRCKQNHLATVWKDCYHEGWIIGLSVGCGVLIITVIIVLVVYIALKKSRRTASVAWDDETDLLNKWDSKQNSIADDGLSTSEQNEQNIEIRSYKQTGENMVDIYHVNSEENPTVQSLKNTDAYKNFATQLENVRTSVRVQIKRPKIMAKEALPDQIPDVDYPVSDFGGVTNPSYSSYWKSYAN